MKLDIRNQHGVLCFAEKEHKEHKGYTKNTMPLTFTQVFFYESLLFVYPQAELV